MVDYCSYSKIEEDIYMRYSSDVFPCATDDERRNNYLFMCSQMKFQTDLWKNDISEDIGVFQLVFSVADKMLRLDGNEIKCKFALAGNFIADGAGLFHMCISGI